VFGSLRGYRKAWLRPDVLAGLTVWAVLVPEALAYATIAGVPPVVGLYAAVPALVLYAALGSSRHLMVGPMSATAALSAAIVSPIAAGDPGRLVALTAALGLVVGLLGVLAGLIRLGFIASLISEPVLKGFIVGLALTIIIGQVPTLLGVAKTGGDFFEQRIEIGRRADLVARPRAWRGRRSLDDPNQDPLPWAQRRGDLSIALGRGRRATAVAFTTTGWPADHDGLAGPSDVDCRGVVAGLEAGPAHTPRVLQFSGPNSFD
jgi:hypothetical protein